MIEKGLQKWYWKPVQWAVSKELYSESGFHYHMCVKFSNNKRWNGAKLHLLTNYNISVHFIDSRQNYISACRYVTKEDNPGHPDLDLTSSPQTSKQIRSCWKNVIQNKMLLQHKRKRIRKSIMMDIIKRQGIRRETELLSLANERADDGLYDLKTFIADRPERVYQELISKTWKLTEVPDLLACQWQSWMEIMPSFSLINCAEGCYQEL